MLLPRSQVCTHTRWVCFDVPRRCRRCRRCSRRLTHSLTPLCVPVGVIEEAFQRDTLSSRRRFMRLSAWLCIGALALFALQDFLKYDIDNDSEADVWRNIAIVRYGMVWPVCFAFLAISRLHMFSYSFVFAQASYVWFVA